MVEGGSAGKHFEGQYSYCPDIREVIVILALQNLRTDVIQGSTVGVSSLPAVNGPAEVAQLAHTLNKTAITLVSTIF